MLTKVVFLLPFLYLLLNTISNSALSFYNIQLLGNESANFFHTDVNIPFFQNVNTVLESCYNFVGYNVCVGKIIYVVPLDKGLKVDFCNRLVDFAKLGNVFLRFQKHCVSLGFVAVNKLHHFYVGKNDLFVATVLDNVCRFQSACNNNGHVLAGVFHTGNFCNNATAIQVDVGIDRFLLLVNLANHQELATIFQSKLDCVDGKISG